MHSYVYIRIVVIALILLSGIGGVASAQRPEAKQIDAAMELAAAYLWKHKLSNGQFVYRINTNREVAVQRKYNMLRHAGTIYALADYESLQPTGRVGLKRASEFLQSQVAPLADVPDVLALWSDPKINFSSDPRKAKLGGTGLGLVAMCRLQQLGIASTSKTRLTQLGNFLLFMQKDDGGFFSIYKPGFPGRDDRWTSLYYPGEAALGLLLLNEVHPNPEWVIGAHEALLFLARSRQGDPQVPADHWALIATQKLLALDPEQHSINRQALLRHAKQIVMQMLAEQRPQHDHPQLNGSFVADGRTTPTATRLEGLLSVRQVLPVSDWQLLADVDDAIHRGIVFLLQSQIKTGSAAGSAVGNAVGGVPRSVMLISEDHPLWNPAANARSTEIRVDYVQHALSAWIGYRKQFLTP